jgi:hypothetical protein
MRVTTAVLALGLLSGCSLYRAIDERLDSWPRYTFPNAHVSMALPNAPSFTTETLKGSPCGELTRTSFSVQGEFGKYSGYFIPMTATCAGNATHAVGLRILVTPPVETGWKESSREDIKTPEGYVGQQTVFRKNGSPARLRTIQVVSSPEGTVGFVSEGDENPVDQEDAAKFFRWIHFAERS